MRTISKWYEPFTQPEPGEMLSPRTPSRVLIADDDPDMRGLISDALTKDGYTVVAAGDGMELLDKLQDALAFPLSMPDVIVLDVVMPRYSGLGVLSALRRANWFTPVIMISAVGEESVVRKAKELGASAFFTKPFDMDDLRTAVVNAAIANSRAKAVSDVT